MAEEERRRQPSATYFAPQEIVDSMASNSHGHTMQHKSLLDSRKIDREQSEQAWKE